MSFALGGPVGLYQNIGKDYDKLYPGRMPELRRACSIQFACKTCKCITCIYMNYRKFSYFSSFAHTKIAKLLL